MPVIQLALLFRSCNIKVRFSLTTITCVVSNIISYSLIILSTLTAHGDNLIKVEFEHLTIKQGLSQSSVYCIYQDKTGFLWIGTMDGLNRYDGYSFKIYRNDPTDSNSIGFNSINSIYEDQAGNLLIGTNGGGLAIYDPKTDNFTNYFHDPNDSNSISDDYVQTVFESSMGAIWIGTTDKLNKFDLSTGQFTHYSRVKRDSADLWTYYLLQIAEREDGLLWISTYDGLDLFNPETGQFTHYSLFTSDSDNNLRDEINTILPEDDGIIWIGTNEGLIKHDSAAGRNIIFINDPANPSSLSNNMVTSICRVSSDGLWIGTQDGLNYFNKKTNTFLRFNAELNNPATINDNSITTVIHDNTGVIWVGTNSGGINKYDPVKRKFSHYFVEPGNEKSLNSNYIYAIFEDQAGYLWLGTDVGGLNKFDRNNNIFTHYLTNPEDPNSLMENNVGAIFEDREGILWIGMSKGFDRFKQSSNEFEHYRYDESDSATFGFYDIYSICQDSSGNIWLGSLGGGLNKFDRKRDTYNHYIFDPKDSTSLSNDYIQALYTDRNGILWIGTSGGGLNRFDSQTEQFISYELPLDNFPIFSITQDASGLLWLGTDGRGISKFNPETEKFTYYTDKDGLPNNVVYGILEDNDGYLWLSTNDGLSKFDPRTESFQNYDYQDGLQSNEFNQGAYFLCDLGEMFFGGINGFNSFYPGQIIDNPNIPNITITDFQIFNKPIKPGPDSPLKHTISDGTTIELSYRQNAIVFHYSALNFSIPEKNQYKYILGGFDQEWIDAGTKRVASYMNLDPGEYTFRVTGSNNDGIWNETGTSVKIQITPPFWQTTIFRIFGILFVVGGLYYVINRRITSIQRQRQSLELLVEKRTSELVKTNIVLNQKIIDHKQAEIALKNSTALLEESQRVARLGSYSFDVQTGLWTSTGILDEIFGIDKNYPHDLDGWIKIIHPEHRDKMLDYFQNEILIKHNVFNREYPIINIANNQERWVHGLGELEFDADGKLVKMIGTIQDITERHQLEEQLRHSQKLESITKLTGGIAHDFNNILGSIFGAVDLLLLQLPPDHPSRRYAKIIIDKGAKAADLVQQMLAYSRQQRLNPVPMNVNTIITDLSMLLKRALEERIELKLNLADDLNLINGDKTAIDQVVMNLCLNAIDAMEDGGILTIRTINRIIESSAQNEHPQVKPGEYIIMEVRDTGHGIKAEIIDLIFEPFYTTREVGEGTGLGLSMVFGLVKQHNGYIFCTSEINIGTTFKIFLPILKLNEIEEYSSQTASKIYAGSGTILVVEDEEDLSEILKEMLVELGYNVLIAHNGQEALQIFADRSQIIDLVISDVIMPKMGGKELYEEMKQTDPLIKFLFTSGYASKGFYKKFEMKPEMTILKKPFRLDEVSSRVKELLEK